jgi:PASTA domain
VEDWVPAAPSARRHRLRRIAAVAAIGGSVSLVALLPAASAAPPPNDSFASAQVIAGESGSVTGSNVEATKEPAEPDHADDSGGKSVWYRWTAPASGNFVFDTCGSGFDTLLAVYTGTAVSALAAIASNDDACAEQSLVVFAATAGLVYSVAVDGYEDATAASGAFTLRWRLLLPPANDDFGAAQPLTGASGTVEGSNLGAGPEPGERRHAGSVGASVWFSWTPPITGTATIETCESSYDTTLAVYTGTAVAALTPVASNDDACRLGSRVRFLARAGTAYRIAVDGTDEAPRGLIRLSWSVVERASNDDFARPRRIAGVRGSVRGSNEGALAESREPTHAGYRASASVWYRWRAPRTMGITFETCDRSFDTVLAVYRGRAMRGAIRVDADDDSCPSSDGSKVDFLATRGVDYMIAVDGVLGATGTFVLRWRPAGPSASPCRVPDVRGMTVPRAKRTLEAADCRIGRVVQSTSALVPRGRVISQFPAPGRRLRFLGRVNLEVSRGRA